MNKIGIYIHIPFCKSKCPYCDFYSLQNRNDLKNDFIESVIREIDSKNGVSCDTIYLGGGTPSVLGKDIVRIIEKAKEKFSFSKGEITVEVNPSSCTADFLKSLSDAGVNRLSIGMQSFNENERKILGRKSSPDEITKIINEAHRVSINNISLDVMLGIPEQTDESLIKTLDFCASSGVTHISTYILKIEENTFFYNHPERYVFPDEDRCAALYELCCSYLEDNGFHQYEISNFSKEGFESRHNLKYWNCEEYLGFGPSAHSFYNGRRFFHEGNLASYIENPLVTVDDGEGGSFEEFVMLRLRLSDGLTEEDSLKRFGKKIPEEMRKNSIPFSDNGYLISDEKGIRLTKKGFLISNYIISELI